MPHTLIYCGNCGIMYPAAINIENYKNKLNGKFDLLLNVLKLMYHGVMAKIINLSR